ncbi:hypothetical protein Bca101_056042 [Brassica carinata]
MSLFDLCCYCEGLLLSILHRSIFMCGLVQQTIIKTLSWLPADRLRIHLHLLLNSNEQQYSLFRDHVERSQSFLHRFPSWPLELESLFFSLLWLLSWQQEQE